MVAAVALIACPLVMLKETECSIALNSTWTSTLPEGIVNVYVFEPPVTSTGERSDFLNTWTFLIAYPFSGITVRVTVSLAAMLPVLSTVTFPPTSVETGETIVLTDTVCSFSVAVKTA